MLAGYATRENTSIFVSRGVGTVYVPIRINCPPDVADARRFGRRPPEEQYVITSRPMPVSAANSQIVFDALKACGVRLMSALPETWLVHLIRLADDDPEVTLVRLAKEEEGVGISIGRAPGRREVGDADAEPRLPRRRSTASSPARSSIACRC